jgi:hypothetical protein
MTSSDQAVIGVDTSEIGEESDISDSVDIIWNPRTICSHILTYWS